MMPDLRRFILALGLLCPFVSPGAARAADDTFRFAYFTDPHIATTDTVCMSAEDAKRRFSSAVAEVNARTDLAFVLFGGDATEFPKADEQGQFVELAKFAKPWYPVPGNHDIGNTFTLRLMNQWLDLGMGRGEAKREYYGFTHGSAAFFALNAFPADPNDAAAVLRVSDMLRECDEFFAANKDAAHKIILAHPPLFIKHAGETDGYFNVPTHLRTRILEVLRRHGVKHWLSGHRHLTDQVTDSETGITVYSNPSTAFAIGEGEKMGYAIFTVGKNGLQREIVTIAE